jgi:hypothetical protein
MANSNGTGANMTSPTRDAVRASMFGRQRKSRKVEAFGHEIELRQPTMGGLMDARDQPTTKESLVRSLIDCAYIPVTGEKLFDEEDKESLMSIPWGPDFGPIADALAELTGVDFKQPSSDSEKTDGSTQSTD